MTTAEIKAYLAENMDEAYARFNQGLIPGVDNITGVRMPALRKLAKKIVRGDWQAYLAEATADTYEEIVLQGLVIGYAADDWATMQPHIAAHVQKIDNWASCDLFCGSLKIVQTQPEAAWASLLPYFASQNTYEIRYAVVMALNFFLTSERIHEVFSLFDSIEHDDYYVKMAIAWAVSMAYVTLPTETMTYLLHNHLDDWTYNKALQKIIESRQVSDGERATMRGMKRKVRKSNETQGAGNH